MAITGNYTLNVNLHPRQMTVFTSQARFRVAAAGRRFGKSWLAADEAVIAALDERNEQRMPVGIIAPTYPTARTIYWQRLLERAGPLVQSSNVNLGVITLINGVEIHVKGADRPDTLRGVGWWFVVLDEYADMKVEVWELIIRPALADAVRFGGGRALFIGSPKGRNHFYTLYEYAVEDTTGEWEAFVFTTADNPYIDASEIESARRSLSSAAFRQEFEASFNSEGGAVFKQEWIKTFGEPPKQGSIYIAVDLAGFAEVEASSKLKNNKLDQTAICVVMVDGIKWYVLDILYGRWGIEETARKIAQTVKKHQPLALGIERGSLKNAVEPFLRQEMQRLNAMARIESLTHGNKIKTERVTWALQGRFEHGTVYLKEGATWVPELTDQLLQFPSRTVHDDLVDSLAYIDQLAQAVIFETASTDDDWQPMDTEVGY
jgi:predicted phage terminase large subunit-like protein